MPESNRENTNIDILSSTSMSVSTDSLEECLGSTSSTDNQDQKPFSDKPQSLQSSHTVKNSQDSGNPFLSSLIYDNYTLLKPNPSNTDLNSEPLTSSGLEASQSFQSAFDTYNRSSTAANLTSNGPYELETQGPPNSIEVQDDENSVSTITPAALLQNQMNPMVTVTIFATLYRFIKYLVGLESREYSNSETQPLLSSPSPNSPGYQYRDLEGQHPPAQQGPAYELLSKYRYFFIVFSVLTAAILLTVVITTGDSKLLALIFKALLCYLLGSNAQNLLGEDFCPA